MELGPNEPTVRTPEFTSRVAELLDLSEMASTLAQTAKNVEARLLGIPNDQNTPGVEPERSNLGNSINEDLILHTDSTRASLQRLSESLNRLNSEA